MGGGLSAPGQTSSTGGDAAGGLSSSGGASNATGGDAAGGVTRSGGTSSTTGGDAAGGLTSSGSTSSTMGSNATGGSTDTGGTTGSAPGGTASTTGGNATGGWMSSGGVAATSSATGGTTQIDSTGYAGASNTGGASGCLGNADCVSNNPCIIGECISGSGCTFHSADDGTPCKQGDLCLANPSCKAGQCAGEVAATQGSVLATEVTFATDMDETGVQSGGLVAFLDDDRLLFADRVEGTGISLSIVGIGNGKLERLSQAWTWTPYYTSTWGTMTWQTRLALQVVGVPNNRFALLSPDGVQVFSTSPTIQPVTETGYLSEISSGVSDAVATSDGQIWACGFGTRRFRVSDAGIVSSESPPVNASGNGFDCNVLALAPDGQTVYATTADGIMRWNGTEAAPTAELVFPGINGTGLTVNDEFLAVQYIGQMAEIGKTEVYSLGSRELVTSYTDAIKPFGISLLPGQLVTGWSSADGNGMAGVALRWAATNAIASDPQGELYFRQRATNEEEWIFAADRFLSRKQLMVTQPWRRVFGYDQDANGLKELTGPGQGSVRDIVGVDESTLVASGPYSTQTIANQNSQLVITAGGTLPAAAQPHRMHVVLPAEGLEKSSFESRPRPWQQIAANETLSLSRATKTGVTRMCDLVVEGGPSKLIQRGNRLYQVAPVEAKGFRVRAYALDVSACASAPAWAPSIDVTVSVDVADDLVDRDAYAIDADPESGRLTIFESRSTRDGAFASGNGLLLWLSSETGNPGDPVRVLGQVTLPPLNADAELVTLGDRTLVFQASQVTAYALTATGLTSAGTTDLGGPIIASILGVNRCASTFLYAVGHDSSFTGYVPEMFVIDLNSVTLRDRYSLPADGLSMAQLGPKLAVATNGSVHLLEPTCGAGEPPARTAWPVPRLNGPNTENLCQVLTAGCVDWSAPAVAGDANRDGCVDGADATIVKNCLNQTADRCRQSILADLNGDGTVTSADAVIIVKNKGSGC